MNHHISREKLSKKSRRELDNKNRLTWGTFNPVTRKTENKKAYNRKKVQRGFDTDSLSEPFSIFPLHDCLTIMNLPKAHL